jgi:hypothetical protein
VVTTVVAVEQTGQTCEAEAVVVKSAHWWNCAARKRIARSRATNVSFPIRMNILL